MPVDREVYEITDADVQAALENIRQDQAMIYTIDGQAQPDHILVAEIQELDRTGVPIIGRKFDNYEIKLNEDDRELTPQLLGIAVGEQRRITLEPEPSQPSSEILAQGQPKKEDRVQSFTVKVKEIKERRLPQLDDNFAKSAGPFESLDDLKSKIENSLKSRAKIRSQYAFERALEDELIKRNDFDPPPTMLNRYLDAIVKDIKSENKNKKLKEQDIKSVYKPIAMRNVKWIIIRQRLIDQIHMEVSDEEIDKRIQELEKLPNSDPQKIGELSTDNEKRKNLKNDILDAKIYSYLASQSNIKEIKKSWSKVESAESGTEETYNQ
jgi:trigger factor